MPFFKNHGPRRAGNDCRTDLQAPETLLVRRSSATAADQVKDKTLTFEPFGSQVPQAARWLVRGDLSPSGWNVPGESFPSSLQSFLSQPLDLNWKLLLFPGSGISQFTL